MVLLWVRRLWLMATSLKEVVGSPLMMQSDWDADAGGACSEHTGVDARDPVSAGQPRPGVHWAALATQCQWTRLTAQVLPSSPLWSPRVMNSQGRDRSHARNRAHVTIPGESDHAPESDMSRVTDTPFPGDF